MKINFSLLFYMKKPKNYKSGPAPIYLRITVDGLRSELATSRSCEPSQWNAQSGRAKGYREAIKSFNTYLDDLQIKVYEAHSQLIKDNELVTAQTIRDRFLGKQSLCPTLVELFKEHNLRMESLIGAEFKAGTLERYKTSLKHTVQFLKWKYNVEDIELKKVDHELLANYDYYLRYIRKCANNSAVKYLKNFGKIIRIAVANGHITNDPLSNYKHTLKKVERVYLTTDELQLMGQKVLATERLTQVRDVFLFCCYTGLAYADVKNLRRNNIVVGIDGENWVSINRQKTNVPSRIPLLPIASELLGRYKENRICLNTGMLLPILSNQKMNSYLKEIADFCGIYKPITFHIARHTFATTVTLLNGVPIESVSKMLGHTNIQTTQHYAKILDIKVGADMAILRKKYNEI